MAKGFFITGTDTGVGKTIITAAMVKIGQRLGFKSAPMKPIETGCRKTASSTQYTGNGGNLLTPKDGAFLKGICGTEESLDLITPVRYEQPLAPMAASELAGPPVDITELNKPFTTLAQKYDLLIIEGVGGILVPIRIDYSVLDMARDFGLPVIVVARPGLGTINHTLLTVQYALQEGLTIAGVIINYSQPAEQTIAEQTNPGVLEKICPVPILGVFPYLPDVTAAALEEAVLNNLNLDLIKKYL